MITGDRIRHILAALGWSPDELARRAGIAVSVVERARQARGEAPITVEHNARLRRAVLGSGRADLIDGMIPPSAVDPAQAAPGDGQPAAGAPEPRRSADARRPVATAPEPPAVDVRALRRQLGMSRIEFVRAFGLTLLEVRGWEKGFPMGPAARAYLAGIAANPDAVRAALRWVSSPRPP